MIKTYMLDTNICSYILRERPGEVLTRLDEVVSQKNCVVISAITYAELRFGAIGKKASPKLAELVRAFVKRLDGILPWDGKAVDATDTIKAKLGALGTPIGPNDTAIAGHAIATHSVLVTNNVKEFSRVKGLIFENWL